MSDAELPGEPMAVPCPAGGRRYRAMQPLVAAVWWLIAAAGAVAVSALPLDVGEGMCGVWGCFPPFQAMLAMHLLWVAALGTTVHAVRGWKPTLLRPFGVLLFAVAVDNDLATWKAWGNRYWPCVYLIDKAGNVRQRWEGELGDAGVKKLTAMIDELRDEKGK